MARAPQDSKKDGKKADEKPAASARDQRLKAALRENLRRRKAQARGRAAPAENPKQGSGAADENER